MLYFLVSRYQNLGWESVLPKTYQIYSNNDLRVIKSRGIGWVGHVAHMGDKRGTYRVLVGEI